MALCFVNVTSGRDPHTYWTQKGTRPQHIKQDVIVLNLLQSRDSYFSWLTSVTFRDQDQMASVLSFLAKTNQSSRWRCRMTKVLASQWYSPNCKIIHLLKEIWCEHCQIISNHSIIDQRHRGVGHCLQWLRDSWFVDTMKTKLRKYRSSLSCPYCVMHKAAIPPSRSHFSKRWNCGNDLSRLRFWQ